jgi:hypothetical protein
VEDRVLELQNQKKELVEGALDENAARGMGRLSVKDLGFLFVCAPFSVKFEGSALSWANELTGHWAIGSCP